MMVGFMMKIHKHQITRLGSPRYTASNIVNLTSYLLTKEANRVAEQVAQANEAASRARLENFLTNLLAKLEAA